MKYIWIGVGGKGPNTLPPRKSVTATERESETRCSSKPFSCRRSYMARPSLNRNCGRRVRNGWSPLRLMVYFWTLWFPLCHCQQCVIQSFWNAFYVILTRRQLRPSNTIRATSPSQMREKRIRFVCPRFLFDYPTHKPCKYIERESANDVHH